MPVKEATITGTNNLTICATTGMTAGIIGGTTGIICRSAGRMDGTTCESDS